jgi:hypothetical protein
VLEHGTILWLEGSRTASPTLGRRGHLLPSLGLGGVSLLFWASETFDFARPPALRREYQICREPS